MNRFQIISWSDKFSTETQNQYLQQISDLIKDGWIPVNLIVRPKPFSDFVTYYQSLYLP